MSQVDNPYKQALESALRRAQPIAAEIGAAVDAAVTAMNNRAWVSGAADAFFGELRGADRDVTSAADGCVANLQDAYDRQPDRVDVAAWQVRWRRLLL